VSESHTEDLRAAEQRAEEIRAGVKVPSQQRPYKAAEAAARDPLGLKEMSRQLYETGQLHLPDDRTIREQVLDEAKQAVCSDRNSEYGEPIDNFSRWSGMCNAAGYRGPGGRELKPHDLAIIMGLGKFSRAMETPGKRDHGVDVAGYGSLMTELAIVED
jgi:hypothetical protein